MRERRNFDEQQNSYISENKIFIIFAAITFILFIALALFSYNSFIKGQESGEVVLIKADEQPYKVTPEDPGGMKVNYQDKEVFNTLIGKEGANSVPDQAADASSVDEPETPMSPEDVLKKEAEAENQAKQQAAAENAAKISESAAEATIPMVPNASVNATTPESSIAQEDANSGSANEASANNTTEEEPAKPDNVAINSGVIKIGEAKQVEKSSTEEPVQKAEEEPKTVKKSQESLKQELAKAESAKVEKPKSIANKEKGASQSLYAKKASASSSAKATDVSAVSKNGKFFVQLSAYSSTHALDKGWNDLKSKYGTVINGSKLTNKIERDGKTIYRLGFGPYKQKISAVEACNKLKAKGQDCIVREM